VNKICTGDQVIVIAGKSKSIRGVVSSRVDREYVLVEGVNLVRKSVKPDPSKGLIGGFVDKVMPIHQSNLAIFNPSTGKSDRVGVKMLPGGARVRVYKSSGEEIKGRLSSGKNL